MLKNPISDKMACEIVWEVYIPGIPEEEISGCFVNKAIAEQAKLYLGDEIKILKDSWNSGDRSIQEICENIPDLIDYYENHKDDIYSIKEPEIREIRMYL